MNTMLTYPNPTTDKAVSSNNQYRNLPDRASPAQPKKDALTDSSGNLAGTLNTRVCTPRDIPPHLLMQYGRLRYQCFRKDDPNVNMNHVMEVEFDHFDQSPHTHYILVSQQTAEGEQLVSAVRLIPTMVDYELEMQSYKYLTAATTLPKSPLIYEGNRWVGKSSRTPLGQLSTGILLITLYHLSRELGFRQIIGTISTKGESWLDKRNSSLARQSNTYTVAEEKIDILVSLMDIDEQWLEAGKTMAGLNNSSSAQISNATMEAVKGQGLAETMPIPPLETTLIETTLIETTLIETTPIETALHTCAA